MIVYDGLVPRVRADEMYAFIARSMFMLGWPDTDMIEHKDEWYFHSSFNEQDVANLGLVNLLSNTVAYEHFKDKTFSRCAVNCTTPSDIHFPHTHSGELVVLYYANLEWMPQWYGETLFYNDDCSEIINAVAYKPGRVVIADGAIPHSIRPQSTLGPKFRFTVATFFK